MNNYIVTSLGFVKSVTFEKQILKHVVEYTQHIRYAMPMKKKGANQLMQKHNIVGFVYNPYAEEPIRSLYEVKRDSESYWDDANKEAIKEWKVKKAFMINECDANFLQSRKLSSRELLTFEEATQKAIKLNQAMLEELQKKLNDQSLILAKINANE